MGILEYLIDIENQPANEGFFSDWKARRAANRAKQKAAEDLSNQWMIDNTPTKDILKQLIEAVKDSDTEPTLLVGKAGVESIKQAFAARIAGKTAETIHRSILYARYDIPDYERRTRNYEPESFPYGYKLMTINNIIFAYLPTTVTNNKDIGINDCYVPVSKNGNTACAEHLDATHVAMSILNHQILN